MLKNRISGLATRMIAKRGVTAEDVALLRDLTLPGGFVTREEAADLVRIERHVSAVHESWGDFFVETLGPHLAWECRPVGAVDEKDAAWLIERAGLDSCGPTPNTAELVARWQAEGIALPPKLMRCIEGVRAKAA